MFLQTHSSRECLACFTGSTEIMQKKSSATLVNVAELFLAVDILSLCFVSNIESVFFSASAYFDGVFDCCMDGGR